MREPQPARRPGVSQCRGQQGALLLPEGEPERTAPCPRALGTVPASASELFPPGRGPLPNTAIQVTQVPDPPPRRRPLSSPWTLLISSDPSHGSPPAGLDLALAERSPGRSSSRTPLEPRGLHAFRPARSTPAAAPKHLKPFLDSLFYFCCQNVFLFTRAFETLQNSCGVFHKRRDTSPLVLALIPIPAALTMGQRPHVRTVTTRRDGGHGVHLCGLVSVFLVCSAGHTSSVGFIS